MKNIKKYLTWEFFILLFVHLFLADATFIGIFLLTIVMLVAMSDHVRLFHVSLFFSYFIISFRLIYLPLTYEWLLKNGTNDYIIQFIKDLKSNNILKLKVLLISGSPAFLSITIRFLQDIYYGQYSSLAGYVYLITFSELALGIFGSYLVLYVWWKLKDIFKKIKTQDSKLNN